MWWRTVLVFNLLASIENTSQLDSNGTELHRGPCCPCPPGWPDHGPAAQSGLADPALGAVDDGAGPDSCACLARDADSEGAASAFFPKAVRALADVMRSEPKDDAKPLLHPEVDLASSVLETLREATDEEYRDAVERDATRAAASDVRSSGNTNIVPEASRDLVTILVSPNDMDGTDDIIAEASHVQETRCIHLPLGTSRASFNYRPPVPQNGLEEILNLPLPGGLLHRQHDSNLAASNVIESVVKAENNLNNFLSGLRLKNDPSLYNLEPNKMSQNINNIQSNQNYSLDIDKPGLGIPVTANQNIAITQGKDQISSENVEECTNNIIVNNDSNRQTVNNDDALDVSQLNFDSDPSPSDIQEQLVEDANRKDSSGANEGILPVLWSPLFNPNIKAQARNQFPLKNLFKLRDVEVIPLDMNKKLPKHELNIPNLNFELIKDKKSKINVFDPVKSPKLSDLFTKSSKMFQENNKIDKEDIAGVNNSDQSENIEIINKKKEITTEILDVVPSPSEMNHVVSTNDNCLTLKKDFDKSANIEIDEVNDLSDNTSTPEEPDIEIVSNSIAKENDMSNISDFGNPEGFDSTSGEAIEDNELSAPENFEAINDSQSLDRSGENEIFIISHDDLSDVPPSSVDLSEINEDKGRSNEVEDISHPLKTLGNIKKSVIEKLDALQINNRKALDNIKHSMEEISEKSDVDEEHIETRYLVSGEEQISDKFLDPTYSPTRTIANKFKEVNTSEEISYQDLQNMSDSILMASVQQEKVTSENTEPHEQKIKAFAKDSKIDICDSEEIGESDIDKGLGLYEAGQAQSKAPELAMNPTVTHSIVNKESIVQSSEINCPTNLKKTAGSKEVETFFSGNAENQNTDNDLEPLASEPLINTILRPSSKSLIEHLGDFESKLRQNIVIQPTSLINADDIFRTPALSIPDISEFDTNIPTLEEIRARVSEILSGLARHVGDEEFSSEVDADDIASNVNSVLLTGESSSDPISILSPLQPIENINLDIIQLKPLPLISGTNPLRTELPGLNLNTYKARLAVPKSLDLKPLKLASTLGNDGGLVGARLSVEPEQKPKTKQKKVKVKENFNFVSSGRNSLQNYPSLADITTNVQKNAQNLLNFPNATTGQTLQANNLIGNIAESLKSHTENAINNIHQTLGPTSLYDIQSNLMKNTNKLPTSNKNLLSTLQVSAPMSTVANNLREQTENTINHFQQSLNAPIKADLSRTIQGNTKNMLMPFKTRGNVLGNALMSSSPLDSVVDNLKSQSENSFKNIQQSLSISPLADINNSIHNTAKNVLKSSVGVASGSDILGHAIRPISGVVDNLRSQTEGAMKNIQQTLNTPALSDISTSIQKSAQHVLKAPIISTGPEYFRSTLEPSLRSLDTVVDSLKSQTQSTMKNMQDSISIPTLADINETVQKHTENLLKSPMVARGGDPIGQVLQASTPIDLKPHTEKAVQDLQKTLKATLRNSPLKNLQQLTNPDDVIQIISNHQEDVNDKLFAIHTDLTDRLESIQNDVMNPERLRSILSPSSNKHFELFAIPLPSSRMSTPDLKKQATVSKNQQPSLSTQRKEFRKSTVPKVSTNKSGATKLGLMRHSSGKERDFPKSLKIPTAASAPAPMRVDRPILPNPLIRDSLRTPSFTQPSAIKGLQGIQKPFIPKYKPLIENKVKVTFGSTTLRPLPAEQVNINQILTPTAKPKITGVRRFKPKPPVRQPTPWNGWGESKSALKPTRIGDVLTSPSADVPRIKAPSKLKLTKPVNNSVRTLPRLAPRIPQPLGKPKSYSKIAATQFRADNRGSDLISSVDKPKTSLLSRFTESLKSKQAQGNLSSSSGRSSPNYEMSPAASEHVEKVVAVEPMKENVSYKCRMMCVKLE